MTTRRRAAAIAAQQHGVLARYQLRRLATRSAIRHELESSDRWIERASGVFQLAGAPASDRAEVVVGMLSYGPGSVVSHATAAWLWEWPGFAANPVHVVRPKSSNSRDPADGTVRHESRRMPVEDTRVLDCYSLTSPSRTLIDLAASVHAGRIERLLDHAWNRRQVDAGSMLECCERLGEAGRPGVRLLRRLVAERGPDWIAPASGLESRVNSLLRTHGLGEVRRQAHVGGRTWLGRVDFLHPAGVILEVQSDTFHTSLTSRRDDAARVAAMSVAGYEVVEVLEYEVWHEPDAWLARFRAAVRRRQAA